jgi:hypothetical protein
MPSAEKPEPPRPQPAIDNPDTARELIRFLLSEPGLPATILGQHRDDGTGHCRLCTDGGQAGRKTWPCRIHDAAHAATEQLARTAGVRFPQPPAPGRPHR